MKKRKKERKVTSAIILPVMEMKREHVKEHIEPKIWVQVDNKTRFGFTCEEQIEKWKKRREGCVIVDNFEYKLNKM